MLRKFLLTAFMAFGISTVVFAAPPEGAVGVVNFATCMTDSKLGKQEQTSFESLKNQMSSLVSDAEKQINELTAKFNDPEYMDGLSPEAEEEMKNKYSMLGEEMNRYQNQYYQVLQQANMKIVQAVGAKIQEASQKVAQNQKLNMVINKEACFFYAPAYDVTNLVVAEMDRTFVQTSKEKALSSAPQLPMKAK